MFRIESKIQTNSTDFRENSEHNKKLLSELKERLEEAKKGGPEHHRQRHIERGKMLPRERVKSLLDRNTPFLELSTLAAWEQYENQCPGAGVITGIGRIHGRECMIVANDATVKGGTYFPMTIKKHIRAQEVAMENRLPCIYLVDSGGIFLPLQIGTFPDKEHFGRIFYNQARMSREGIPQIAVVMGSCTAGGAYVPAMSDEVVQVKKQGTIFIGGPPLVEAATGEKVTAEELGGADVHCRISGVSDHYANNDEHAIQITRNIVETLDRNKKFELDVQEPEDPHYDPEELYGIIPKTTTKPYDIREVIARIVDGSKFQEFKEPYAPTIVTGFARIMGMPVGIVANNGVLFPETARKGAHFVSLCGMRKIPLVFLQNITGFIVGKQYEHGGIPRDGAKMVHAVSNVDVPRFTVIVGASNGAGNYAMCGRGYLPRLLWMWPNSRISVMGGEQAAGVLTDVKINQLKKAGKEVPEKEIEDMRQRILDEYEHDSTAYFSTSRLWDDGILDPVDTRNALALGISMSLNVEVPEYRMGIFRM
jgi:acetyl-CoA carboxylase carboxyltransferase component